MPQPPKNYRDFLSLVKIVEDLRGPNGCPWDKEQTHKSLTKYVIEEAHELAEAIDRNDLENTIEELGDVLFQVILHSELGKQSKEFDLEDVIEAISRKMVRRHPHVFANSKVANSKEVLKNWSEIKVSEKSQKPQPESFDIPIGLPALIKSQKIGKKTREVNFDWPSVSAVVEKIEEELSELKLAIEKGSKKEQSHELGDLLFTTAQLGRHLDLDPEQSLRQTNLRFERRYFHMKNLCKEELIDFSNLTPEQFEVFWAQTKRDLKNLE